MASAASFLNGSPATSREAASPPGEPGHVRPHLHVGDLELDGLVGADRPAEGVPLLGVLHRLVHAALREAGGQRGDGDRGPRRGCAGTGRSRGPPRPAGCRPAPGRRRRTARGCPRRSSRPSSTGAATVKPGVPDGTMIEEISGLPSALRPVTAVTVTRPVMSVPELVMKHLVPLITHSSPPVETAVVRVPPASEPPPGSVSPNAPSDLARSTAAAATPASAPRCRRGGSASRPARRPPPG